MTKDTEAGAHDAIAMIDETRDEIDYLLDYCVYRQKRTMPKVMKRIVKYAHEECLSLPAIRTRLLAAFDRAAEKGA